MRISDWSSDVCSSDLSAHDGKTITKNADAVWSDYDPAPLYAGSKSLPLQYITMRDGVQLAAYVTVPADADGNAIDTPLPVVLVQTSYNGAAGSVVSAIGDRKSTRLNSSH